MVVAMGYFPGDQELAKKLASWICELGPNKGHSFLIARDVRCTGDESIKYDLEKVFDKVEVIEIPEKVDGWKFAPNIVIRNIAVNIENMNPIPWLFIEPDVVPLKSGWVDLLAKEYDEKKKPFLGDFVNVKDVTPHLSGIAVYPGKVTDHAPNIKFAALSEIPWDVYAADQTVPRMAQSRYIAHRWLHPAFNNQSEVDNLLGQLGDAVLFHSDHSGTLIDFLRERRNPPPAQQTQSTGILEAGIGTCDIFIKTYKQDDDWIGWCKRSIKKFATGFRKSITIHDEKEYGNDKYLSQQVFKMYADTFTDADHILYIDSDTIFTQPVTPEMYFKNGKFLWMMTPIDQAHPNEQQAWRRVMEKFLGKPPEFEWMRRFPFVLPRWLLSELRAFCVRTHGVELKDYVMAQPYREFSEFNCLGFYAYEYHRDKFEWFDTSKHPENEWPVLTVDQQWSHNPIPVEKWEQILSSRHGDNKTVESGLRGSRHTTETPKPATQIALPVSSDTKTRRVTGRKQKTLEGRESNRAVQNQPQASPAPLPSLLAEVAKHFTSPLQKGRIFKKLKSYPIVK